MAGDDPGHLVVMALKSAPGAAEVAALRAAIRGREAAAVVGRELYLTFFKSYTEKVWGTPCDQISAEWGAQRIKGLSLTTAIKHFLRKTFSRKTTGDVAQKGTDTSLIERFMYPKFGPGQLWEHAADQIIAKGGEIRMGWKVDRVHCEGSRVVSIEAVNEAGQRETIAGFHAGATSPAYGTAKSSPLSRASGKRPSCFRCCSATRRCPRTICTP